MAEPQKIDKKGKKQPEAPPEGTDPAMQAAEAADDVMYVRGQKQDLDDEQLALRRARFAEEQRRLSDEEAQAAREQEEEQRQKQQQENADQQDQEHTGRQKTALGKLHNSYLRVEDRGDYLTVARGKEPMSDKQLRAVIMTAALEKGWKNLYFYKDRTHIDPELTARAGAMIEKLQGEGMPLEGIAIRANRTRQRYTTNEQGERETYVEPWNQGKLRGPWCKATRNCSNTVEEIRERFGHAVDVGKEKGMMKMCYRKEEQPAAPPPTTPPAGGAVG